MFGKRKAETERRIRALENDLQALAREITGPRSLHERVSSLEKATTSWCLLSPEQAKRSEFFRQYTTVSVRQAVDQILAHLGLKIEVTDAVPSEIKLGKTKDSRGRS